MERRASLVLIVLVQSTVQFHLAAEHYLRLQPEGLKLGELYREPLSEFMDYDPDQSKAGGAGLLVIELPSDSSPRVEQKTSIIVEKDVEEIAFEDPSSRSIVIESFLTEEVEAGQRAGVGEGLGSNDSEVSRRLRRDLGYVDRDLHNFAPRRFRGSKMRF